MLVSAIQSLFHSFGSGITEPTYGVTLNNRGSSFTLDKGHANSLQPLKKPLHTLSAVIVSDPEGELVFGLSGGHFRPQLHYEILTNIYHYGMDLQGLWSTRGSYGTHPRRSSKLRKV